MAHDVFISYSHKDKAMADAICSRLEQDGIRCWYAPRDIRPGADWAASIIEAIESARIMVLVFTDASNASPQVLREINNAVSAGVVLVPFKLTEAPPNKGMKYYLSTVHWLDAMNIPRESSIANLCTLVHSVLDGETPQQGSSAKPAETAPVPVKRNRRWIPAAIAVLAVAALGIILWLSGVFNKPPEEKPDITEALAVTEAATAEPTAVPTEAPTEEPTSEPTEEPTAVPTETPTEAPTEAPTAEPTPEPTEVPTDTPAPEPTEAPTPEPTPEPTDTPTPVPTDTPEPTPTPTPIPTPTPTEVPTPTPTPEPTREPTYSTSADDYMYIEGGKGITLQKYMGNADVVIIPQEIDGYPVRKIDEECFAKHQEILKVVLPDSLRSFEYKAFYGCSALREINFPEGLNEVGGWSLAHTAVTEVELPDSVTKLGYGAFYGCTKLTKVVLSPNIVKLDENTFSNCARLKTVTIPSADIKIDYEAFNEGKAVTIIGVPGSFSEKYAQAMNLKFEAYPAE